MIFFIIAYLGIFLLAINTVLYLKALPQKSKAFKIYSRYLILILLIEIFTVVFAQILNKNNLFLSNVFLIIQFIFLSIFYFELLQNRLIYFVSCLVMFFLVYQYFSDIKLFSIYNALGITITQSILIVYSIIYFYQSLHKRTPEFLIVNIGIFLYLICSTLIFASGNLVFDVKIPTKTYFLLLKVNGILYILYQILIFIEWRKNYYKKIPKSS